MRRKRFSHCLALGLSLAAPMLPSSLAAQPVEPGKEGELARFVKPENGARACFTRTYDPAHLERHPDQTVTEMRFRLAYYMHEPDEYYPKGQRNYYFGLTARLRGRPAVPVTAIGECRPTEDGKAIWCGVECDGGGVLVSRRDGGKVLVDLEATGRIRMTEGCDEEENAIDLEPGKDDKTFLLAQTAECPAYEDW
jgi:hypothetical protein